MLPIQKISSSAKRKRDSTTGKDWSEQTADYYISQFSYTAHHDEITKLRRAIDGIIDQKDYEYLKNPFNIKDTSKLRYGARLRDYNILKGIANLLMGEFGRRTHEYTVTDFNPEEENRYKDELLVATKNYYSQLAINRLNEQGFPTGENSKELPDYKEYVDNFKRTFDQNRVISGQEAIDYIRYEQELDSKFLDLYWDWLILGEINTYKTVRYEDVDYEYVPAEELFLPLVNGITYGEDCPFGIRRRIMSINDIIDNFRDSISKKDLDRLHNYRNKSNNELSIGKNINVSKGGYIHFKSVDLDCESDYLLNSDLGEGIEVYHVVWKSFKKIGELTFIDELGQNRKREVDDTYTLNKELGDISIEWEWQTELRETWRAGNDIYWDKQEIPYSRSELNNNSVVKLPYNKIKTRSQNGSIQSIIKQGIPYQLLINGLHYQLEKVMNKNKDKITVMPYGLVPRKKGISTKQQMYHADASSILWIDETAPNAQFAAQMIKVLDMSLGQYIKDIIELMKYIKQEYWDEIGMNQQRYSDIDQKAGKGVTEQAIIRSSIITYELNRRVDKLIERDYKGLLDLSKYAWINGKKSKYIRSDGSSAFINLNSDNAKTHLETDYGIFIRDAQEMTEALQGYRGLALTFAQNKGSMSGMAELYTNNNMDKLKDIVTKIEDNNKLYEEKIREAEQEHEINVKNIEANIRKEDRELEKYKIDKQYESTIEAAEIRASNNKRDNHIKDTDLDIQLAAHKIDKENKETALKEKEINNKNKQLNNTK